MNRKKFIIFTLALCFFVVHSSLRGVASPLTSRTFNLENISDDDIFLSELPVFILVADDNTFETVFSSVFPSSEKFPIEKRNQVFELIRILGSAPGVFSSCDSFKLVFKEKLHETLGFSVDDAKEIAEKMTDPETLSQMHQDFVSAIDALKIKDAFAPQRIIIDKDGSFRPYDFKNFSGQEITKEVVQEILSNSKIPKSVERVEGINEKEMISPVALTDMGETVLLKKGVISSDIKPIMFIHPINRKAIAYAARRDSQMKAPEKKSLSLLGKIVPVYNLTLDGVNMEKLQAFLSPLTLPSTIKQVEILVSEKMGRETVCLTDQGETLLVSESLDASKIVEASYLTASERREILDRVDILDNQIDMNFYLATVPAMISGLDLREVFERLVQELKKNTYDTGVNYSAEAIAVAVIRSTSEAANFVSSQFFQKALMDQGLEKNTAQRMSEENVIRKISEIVFSVREKVLAMAGKKVVVYIDNREVPLLTTGSISNYTPRQIALAQERLINERVILSQVDEIILVEDLHRSLGYTVRSNGKIKAYLSSVFLLDDEVIPPINWMPTFGDPLLFPDLSMPHVIVSTMHPQVKMVLAAAGEREEARKEIAEKTDFQSFVFYPSETGSVVDNGNGRKVLLQDLQKMSYQQKIVVIADDSLLSSLNIDLAVWMFGLPVIEKAILLVNNGRFKSSTDKTEYDFTAVSEEFISELHQPIIEQNTMIIKEELMNEEGIFIDGARVVPAADFSIGRMDARIRKIPLNEKQKTEYVQGKVVLELGEDLAIAIMNGDVSVAQLRRVLKGGKIKLAPEEKRKWDRQRKLYQAKIKSQSAIDLFSSEAIDQESSKGERMFTAGLNKAFRTSTDWIEDRIEGEEILKGYLVSESLDVTFDQLFEPIQNGQDINQIKVAALLKICSDIQAQNALIFKKE